MRRKGSRYETSRSFSGDTDFNGFRERKLSTAPGVVEHTMLHSDRLDQLANDYYKEDRRWWRVLDANPEFLYGFDLFDKDMQGDVIVIPTSRETGR